MWCCWPMVASWPRAPRQRCAPAATRWYASLWTPLPMGRCASTTLRSIQVMISECADDLLDQSSPSRAGHSSEVDRRGLWRTPVLASAAVAGGHSEASAAAHRADLFPGQLLAGHHHGVGRLRRVRAGAAGLLHLATVWLQRGAGPDGGAVSGARTRAGGGRTAVCRSRWHGPDGRHWLDEGGRAVVRHGNDGGGPHSAGPGATFLGWGHRHAAARGGVLGRGGARWLGRGCGHDR